MAAHFLSPKMYDQEEIMSMNVIREETLATLLKTTQDYLCETVPQCVFIHGSAGSGKTFLLMQLKGRLSAQADVWYHDFFFDSPEILQDLCARIESKKISPRTIILADNFNRILDNSSERSALFRLRKLLSENNAPLLIASGRSVPDAVLHYNEAFYDFFKLMYLEPISKEECINTVKNMSPLPEQYLVDLEKMFNVVEETPLMIQLITNQILLGRYSFHDMSAGIIDAMAPYYEALISNLSPKCREILITLLIHGPGNLPSIRNLTGYSSGTISSYLQILMDKGFVMRKSSGARTGVYFVQDKLMEMWAKAYFETASLSLP